MATIRETLKGARPLAGSHWSLPAVLLVVGVLLLLAQPCKRGPYYVEYIAIAVTVCLALWSNHVARAPVQSAHGAALIVGRALYDFVLLVGLLLLVSFPIAIFLPAYQCYTDRARASEVLLMGSFMRAEIEARAAKLGTLTGAGRGLEITPTGRTRAELVANDGVIVVVGEDPPVVFMLSPTLSGGAVIWKCLGFPEKAVPMTCRGNDAL